MNGQSITSTVYSLKNGHEASVREMVSEFGLTENQFYEKVRERLRDYWESRSEVKDMAGDPFYQTLVDQTLNEDNIRKCVPFVNAEGELGFIAFIYSPAGASGYYHLMNMAGEYHTEEPSCHIVH